MNYSPLSPDRLLNGVRLRGNAGGSPFGNLHRQRLPRRFFLSDIDGMVLTENSRYSEYAVAGDRVAFAAFIDAKATEAAAERVPLRRLVLCALCRAVAAAQPVAPLAFEVIGKAEPFTMWELSTTSAARTGRRWCLTADNWPQVWQAAGLTYTRDRLTAWLKPNHGCSEVIFSLLSDKPWGKSA